MIRRDATDDTLFAQVTEGDASAVEELLRRYTDRVGKKVRGHFLPGGDRDDLWQEAMIGLLAAVRAYDPERSVPFSAFAEVCIERSIVTALRRANRRKDRALNSAVSLGSGLVADLTSSVARSSDPADEVVAVSAVGELAVWLTHSLTTLELEALRLRDQGHSYAEIAVLTRSGEKAVDNAVQRGRQKIRRYVDGRR